MSGPVVPAGGKLREVVAQWLARRDMDGSQQSWHEDADALLTFIRPAMEAEGKRRAAEVLRAAAAEQRAEAGNVPDTDEGTHADGHRCAATFLDRRAAALAPENARPE